MSDFRPILPRSSRPKVSRRDEATLLRLIRRFDREGLIGVINDLPVEPKRRGAPQLPRLRQSMLVALFKIGSLSHKGSRSQFSARLFDAVELAHARTVAKGRPKKTVYKTARALDQDLQRGLKQPDEVLIRGMIRALIRWRKTNVIPEAPEAGFYLGGRSHLMVTPLNPDLLTRWIDNAIANRSSISPPKEPQQ